LVSACLLGEPVRYNGRDLRSDHPILQRWIEDDAVIPCCPEVAAQMPTPRAPAEIQGGNGGLVLAGAARVKDIDGRDVTDAFLQGAQRALALCREHRLSLAILTDGSPSCGSSYTYAGTFDGAKAAGAGVTATLLMQHGIRVFSQHELEAAYRYYLALRGR